MPILKVLAGSDDKFEPKPEVLDVPSVPAGDSKKLENFEVCPWFCKPADYTALESREGLRG